MSQLSLWQRSGDLNDSTGLRFETHDDALRFARHVAEDGRRRARQWGLSFVEDYLNNRAKICIVFRADWNSQKVQFIAEFIPVASAQEAWAGNVNRLGRINVDAISVVTQGDADQACMLCLSSKSQEPVEACIPSVMRIKCTNEPDEFEVCVSQPTLDFAVQVYGCGAKGEVNALCIRASRQNDSIAGCLVEDVFDVCDYVACQYSQPWRDSLLEPVAKHLLSCLIVHAADNRVRASLQEGGCPMLEVVDAFFCGIE